MKDWIKRLILCSSFGFGVFGIVNFEQGGRWFILSLLVMVYLSFFGLVCMIVEDAVKEEEGE